MCVDEAMAMDEEFDLFRDFGLDPDAATRPVESRVRASFSALQMFGQYLGTVLMTCMGVGMTWGLWHLPAPWHGPGALLGAIGGGWILWRGTHLDQAWVELEGTTLRTRHLYTGRERERDLSEVSEIVSVILSRGSTEANIAAALWGRIKALLLRFQDGSTPIQISRADPAMRGARELMEAILFRMRELGELDADVHVVQGSPLVTRIRWRNR
ncbi:MAG: hypothetical protein KDA58_14630 [Planctomycetaceae bacterium]|nr:hypothetical protein [Planctomycetaceae bacterium]